jgi:hypothetical protein
LRYLDDDNDLGTAFAEDVWLFNIPVRLASDAVKYFGVQPLSQSVEVNVTPGEPKSPLSGDLNVRFYETLPFVWAWRSSQSKQAAEKLSVHLKKLEVRVVPTLIANLSLYDVQHEVKRRWHVTNDTIYLHKDHVNEAELAQALAKIVDVRSEADFYENLLRCNNRHQRKEKLMSKGIADAEVERCFREYLGRSDEEDQEQQGGVNIPTEVDEGCTTFQPPSIPSNETHLQQSPPSAQQGKTTEKPQFPPPAEHPLCLKDSLTIDYVLGRPPEQGTGHSRGGGDGGMGQEGHALTEEEKTELEKAGRVLAVRELESMGFSVEKMPQSNPGFDLRAKKDEDELRVEVKAHCGRATAVDVTQREYKEYLGQQGYRWELWNVEHIAKDDSCSVVITRYDQIPDDALDARTFRVDLKKCQGKLQD